MKTVLKTSILLNFLLSGVVLLLISGGGYHEATAGTEASKAEGFISQPYDGNDPQTAAVDMKPSSFRWSQLESPNYLRYIANLRGIGCPEQTIRDIISADVHSLYARRQDELRRARPDNEAAIADGLERLRHEEVEVLLRLLGPTPPSQDAADTPVLAALTPHEKFRAAFEKRELERPVSVPLAFQQVNAEELKMSPDQVQVIKGLREKFQQQIGDSGTNPADPSYLKRWQALQRENDEWMGLLLGRDVRLKYQLEALRQTEATQTTQGGF